MKTLNRSGTGAKGSTTIISRCPLDHSGSPPATRRILRRSQLHRAAAPVADRWAAAFKLPYGAKIMSPGKRQAALATQIEGVIADDCRGRILPFDSPAAVAFADIAAQRRLPGRPISQAAA